MIWRTFQTMKKHMVQRRMMHLLAPHPFVPDYQPMHLKLENQKHSTIAEALVASLTLDEKLGLLGGIDEFCVPGVPRLGLKPIWTSDATLGLRGWQTEVTDFPAGTAMASTFNKDLLRSAGSVIGKECRALGVGILLGPGVNLARVPICGRNFEYLGEDPYLAGELAVAYIQGVQGEGVIATVKHYACNNSEYDRHKSNSVVDQRSLMELYLPAFKKAVEAGVLAVMTSYNQVNGEYTSEHAYLLKELLRGEWGFKGLVVSDWNSLYSTRQVLLHGVDLEMPKAKYLEPSLVKKELEAGTISVEHIDQKLLHLFHAYEQAQLFSKPIADKQVLLACEDHRAVALEVAKQSLVLLKNEGAVLPLVPKRGMKVCVGGGNAFKVASGGGSSMIQMEGERETFASLMQKEMDHEVMTLPSYWWNNVRSCAAVTQADAVVLVVGFDHTTESECYDRPWALPKREVKGILNAAALNRNTIVVVQSGGALEMESWQDKVRALLYCSYLGSSGAEALKSTLFGRSNPSGKLPFSMAGNLSDWRSMRSYPKDFEALDPKRVNKGQGDPNIRMVEDLSYTENLLVGYRQFDTEGPQALYPFGHGLSYTTFAYSDLHVEKIRRDQVLVSCTLSNDGPCAGSEVVQLYLKELSPVVFRAEQELKAFAKVTLAPKTSERVTFSLGEDSFSHYDLDQWAFVRSKSAFEYRIGSSSRDIRLRAIL